MLLQVSQASLLWLWHVWTSGCIFEPLIRQELGPAFPFPRVHVCTQCHDRTRQFAWATGQSAFWSKPLVSLGSPGFMPTSQLLG